MYLPSITILLLVAQLNADSNIVGQLHQTCDGGHCLPKHLCPTGSVNGGRMLERNGLIKLWVDEENECGDFMKICCKGSNRNAKITNQKCGISNPRGLVYDVESNLTYAKYAEFPWTVAIFQMSFSLKTVELTHVGGGTLIHPKFVLTAAHTLKTTHRYVARFGEWNMKSDAEIYPAQDIEIKEHFIHPSYRVAWALENDIALAVLKQNVIYSEHIRPLCLPNSQDVFDGQRCIETGWGMDIRTGQPAAIMKRMELNIVSHTRCDMSFRRQGVLSGLHRSIMCVEQAQDQNTCIKDGGSPLACQRYDGSYVLAGIASWVVYCNQSEFPGGHVDVAKFVGWINDMIEGYELRAYRDRSTLKPILYAASYQESKGK